MSTWVGYLVGLNELWRRHGLEPTPSEFADYHRVPVGRAKVALLRLSRMGMARRRKDPRSGRTKRPYRYRPSKRGALEASMRGTDPAVADELHQIEQIDEMEALVEAGQFFGANQFYATRRKGWSGIWRHAARQLLFKLYADRDRARQEELVAAAAQVMMKSLEAVGRALDSWQKVSDRPSWHAGDSSEQTSAPSRPTHRPASGVHSCDIGSHVPPALRWRASHITLEPAINPATGEFLLDRENRPIYNQLYAPWEPDPGGKVSAAVAAAAVACAVVVGEDRVTIQGEKYKARIAAIEAENGDLRLRLRMKTFEANLSEEVHRISLAFAEHQLAAERARIDEWITAWNESLSSSDTTALMLREGFATIGTALETRSERLDRSLSALEPFAATLGRLFERWADREISSAVRAAPQPADRKTRVKVKAL